MERTKTEYGGYLPLELPPEKQFFYSNYKNVLMYNTIKAAISVIQKTINVSTVYVPVYLCPNVISELQRCFTNVVFVKLDNNLLPIIENTEDKLIYLVNYFGIMDNRIRKYIKKNPNSIFLLDNAHSFFCKPILVDNVFNLYSCKKFFGVPDGGCLITKNQIGTQLPMIFANSYSNYLIQSFEQGTNSCYIEKKKVDEQINLNYAGISIFSLELLSRIDYRRVIKIRKRNFKLYNKAFKNNIIKCERNSIPYLFPLNVNENIKKKLIEEKIYVPTLWGQVLDENDTYTFEKKLTENTLFLPVDQRYSSNDIKYIIQKIKALLNESK